MLLQRCGLLVTVFVVLAAGCAPPVDLPATESAAAPTLTPQALPTATTTPTRAPTATATLTPTPAPLTAAEIYAHVSPAVVYVETPAYTGSGILVAGGYIVTNAHVVWPYAEARVVFPDGVEHLNVPLLNHDLLADLAVLGPLDSAVDPLPFVDGEHLVTGSTVYLIGYPGEVERFPTPTIVSGVISRLRESAAAGVTYFQTDAQAAGGQSGGVLISELGDIIGISGMSFTEARFGLSASAADLWPRIERLMAGDDLGGLGNRRIPLEGGSREHQFELAGYWDARAFVAAGLAGSTLEVVVESDNDAAFEVLDVYGQRVLSVDDGFTGPEGGSARLRLAAPHFIVVSQKTENVGEFRLRSNQPLIAYHDTDDGRRLKLDHPAWASVDFPGDRDYYLMDLEAGDTIHLRVTSSMIDPYLLVDYEGAGEAQMIYDDDSGGGVFGLDAELTYRAPHAGRYQVVVADSMGSAIGAYQLAASLPGAEAPTPSAPQPTPTPINSPVGPMALYTSLRYPFVIEYPAQWTALAAQPELGIVASFASDNGWFRVTEADLASGGLASLTTAEYTELVVKHLRANVADFSLIARRQARSATGQDVMVLEYTFYGGAYRVSQLMYVHEGRIAFGAAYTVATSDFQRLKPIIDYSFDSFRSADR
jgi:hypothetical protein